MINETKNSFWKIADYKGTESPSSYKYHKTIMVLRSSIIVVDFVLSDWSALGKLRNHISIWESRNGGRYRSFELSFVTRNNAGYFILKLPRYINVQYLYNAFPDHSWVVLDIYTPYKEINFEIDSSFDYKSDSQKELVEYLTRKGRYIDLPDIPIEVIKGPTSLGKSFAMIKYWESSKGVLCGIFSKHNHLSAFKDEVKKFTDVEEHQIIIIDSLDSLFSIKIEDGYKLLLVTHRLISNAIYGGEIPLKNLIAAFKTIGIKTILFDEAHLELLSLLGIVMNSNVYKIICLSATPSRTKQEEIRMMELALPMDDMFTITAEKRADIYQLQFNMGFTTNDLIEMYGESGKKNFNVYNFYKTIDGNYAVKSKWLNIIYHNLLDQYGSTVLVLASSLNFISMIVENIQESFPDKRVMEYSSKANLAENGKHILENSDIIVTTEKSFNASINPLNVTRMIISAPIVSPVWVEQVIGRLRGVNGSPCTIIDIAPIDHDRLIFQAKKRLETYHLIGRHIEICEE